MSFGIGERIKNRRIELQLTQMDLAERMGYKSKAAICKVERGDDNITSDRVSKFAKALNCTEAYLMGWDDEPQSELIQDLEDKKNDGDRMANAFYNALNPNFIRQMGVEEYNLIDDYRKLDDESKRQLVLMMAFLKEQNNKK